MGMWTLKPVPQGAEVDAGGLHRHLGLGSLTLMGVGGTIGAGIFVITGTAAANYAGPGIALSFVLAGLTCLCAALCYAELASMIPVSGSAYTYTYATLGEFIAWMIGWNLILEYLFATSTIASGWSGYFTAFLAEIGVFLPHWLTTAPLMLGQDGALVRSGAWLNIPAIAIVLFLTTVLMFGIRAAARWNAAMVAVKIAVVLLVIGFGAFHVRAENWVPFIPDNRGEFGEFGVSGVVRAAGIVFFAYVGFDMVSSSAQEARNPRRDIPLSLLFSLGICTALYLAMCLVMTGLAHYTQLNVPHPVFVAIAQGGEPLAWLKPLISVGAIIGLASAMLVTLYGQTRIFFAMARDGLLPDAFSKVHPVYRTPVFGTWFVGLGAALIAGLLPIGLLGELVSIGTLMAFSIVCLGVLILRRTKADWPRAFRAPLIWPVAICGIGGCSYLMYTLPGDTWIRLAVWLAIGMIVYFGYGIRRSVLVRGTASAVQV